MNFITEIFTTSGGLVHFFIKAFGVVLSVIFLIYALVMIKQIGVMLRTIQRTGGNTLRFLSYTQFFVALLLLIIAAVVL